MTERTYQKLLELGIAAFKNHHGVVLDATFSGAAQRELLRKELRRGEGPAPDDRTHDR